MTNEQLAVLLSNYRDSIESILKELEDNLLDEFSVKKVSFLGKEYRVAPILDGLNHFYRKLGSDIEILSSGDEGVEI